jgi:hypothetical protein
MSDGATEVTVESLGDSLDDLIKAADAVDLVKGGDANRVEHSGRVDESGTKSGKAESSGRASYSDAGSLDRMMIGKLADLGFDANQISAMEAALVGKQEEEDDDDDDDDDSDVEIEIAKMRAYAKQNGSLKGYQMGKSDYFDAIGEPLVKSLDQFREDPDINDALDVSPYLEAVTARTAEQIDAVNASLHKGFGSQATVNRAMAGAMHQMGSLIKSQAAVIEEMGARLGIVERQPNPQKGVTNAQGLQKSMPGEAGAGGEQLSKSEIVSTLSYMNLEKGIRSIDGQSTSEAIGLLEAGDVASPAVLKAVNDFHTANPNESQTARQYA